MLIEYIGLKAVKTDNVAGTGTVWTGRGDVQEVADEAAAAKLVACDTVWREHVSPNVEAQEDPAATEPADLLAGMDDAALKAYAAEQGLTIDGRKKGDKLRQAIRDAMKG